MLHATHSRGREEGRDTLGAKVNQLGAMISNSQCFVAEVGRFWWVELVQLAVEDVEAVETHLGLNDRRITYTRAVRHHRRAVAWYARGVVELLLFRTATAGSHVTVSAVAVDHCDPKRGHERSTTR